MAAHGSDAFGSWQLAVGSWQLAVGGWQLAGNLQASPLPARTDARTHAETGTDMQLQLPAARHLQGLKQLPASPQRIQVVSLACLLTPGRAGYTEC